MDEVLKVFTLFLILAVCAHRGRAGKAFGDGAGGDRRRGDLRAGLREPRHRSSTASLGLLPHAALIALAPFVGRKPTMRFVGGKLAETSSRG
jgi:hypothetical protein